MQIETQDDAKLLDVFSYTNTSGQKKSVPRGLCLAQVRSQSANLRTVLRMLYTQWSLALAWTPASRWMLVVALCPLHRL